MGSPKKARVIYPDTDGWAAWDVATLPRTICPACGEQFVARPNQQYCKPAHRRATGGKPS